MLLDRLGERYGCRPSSLVGATDALALALDMECMEAGIIGAKRMIGDGMVFPVVIVAR